MKRRINQFIDRYFNQLVCLAGAAVVIFVVAANLRSDAMRRYHVTCYSGGVVMYDGTLNGFDVDVETGLRVSLPSECIWERLK